MLTRAILKINIPKLKKNITQFKKKLPLGVIENPWIFS